MSPWDVGLIGIRPWNALLIGRRAGKMTSAIDPRSILDIHSMLGVQANVPRRHLPACRRVGVGELCGYGGIGRVACCQYGRHFVFTTDLCSSVASA